MGGGYKVSHHTHPPNLVPTGPIQYAPTPSHIHPSYNYNVLIYFKFIYFCKNYWQKLKNRAAHGPVWSGLTEKSDQTRNSGLENFQTRPDQSKDQTGPDRTVLERSGLVWSTVFFIFLYFFNWDRILATF